MGVWTAGCNGCHFFQKGSWEGVVWDGIGCGTGERMHFLTLVPPLSLRFDPKAGMHLKVGRREVSRVVAKAVTGGWESGLEAGTKGFEGCVGGGQQLAGLSVPSKMVWGTFSPLQV